MNKTQRSYRSLRLNRETLRLLAQVDGPALGRVVGGCSQSCTYECCRAETVPWCPSQEPPSCCC